VTTHDAVSFALVAAVLFAAAVVATIVPARRAAYVDPAKVLRG
jgi:ABC-type lipoprotein release transport system permease subunit